MTARSLTWSDARRLRVHAQGLGAARSSDVVKVVRSAGAIQAQDRLGELLGVGTRSVGLTALTVEQARMEDRSIARTWLMRGTLHLVPSEDLRWMLNLLGEAMDAKARRRRRDLGISDEDHARVLHVLRQEMTGAGPMSRAEIAELLRSAGLPWEGQATPHLLRTASLLGVICFGPDRDGESTHVSLGDWLPSDGMQPENPAAELARRYFDAYGPATASDFRWWSGLPAKVAREGFNQIIDELVEMDVEGTPMWMSLQAAQDTDSVLAHPTGTLRVAGPFDPYLLGYSKRELGVSETRLKRVNAGGGMIRSCILIDGRLIGTWDRARRKSGLTITVRVFDPLAADEAEQLEREFAAIGQFLGLEIRYRVMVE